jgi:hypothetical protein
MWGLTCEESSELHGCQHVDRVSFRMEIDFPGEGERNWTGRVCATPGPAGPKAFLWWNELRTRSRGAVEIAFDHENGDIIIETNLAAKICRAAEDIGHELLRGQ